MDGERQTSGTAVLVRPATFGFHAEAAQSNAFASACNDPEVQTRALVEFEDLAARLADAGVEVLVLDDAAGAAKPDAVFPNNWVSFHEDGRLVLYPMATVARRRERNLDGLRNLLHGAGFDVRTIVDLTAHEREGRFLEGTGSLILDRPGGRAFVSLSPRTHPGVVREWGTALGYSTVIFDARDRSGAPIYHTNVLLSLGTRFAVLCPEAVDARDRMRVVAALREAGRELIEVDYDQMCGFACNIIELRGKSGGPVIAMSSTALQAFSRGQRQQLERHGELVDAAIPTIEKVGGGSVRCMIADVHLPRRQPADVVKPGQFPGLA